MVGGWANPLQPLPQGLVLTFNFDVDPDPELDNFFFPKQANSHYQEPSCTWTLDQAVHNYLSNWREEFSINPSLILIVMSSQGINDHFRRERYI